MSEGINCMAWLSFMLKSCYEPLKECVPGALQCHQQRSHSQMWPGAHQAQLMALRQPELLRI